MKNINFLVVFILGYIISNFTYGQFRYAPLKCGNVWVYEDAVYQGLVYRAEIVDSSIIIDSIKYLGYGVGYQTQYFRAVRLREDNFFVVREDSTFPEPFRERKYYKKNAQIGDTWQVNYGGTFPAIYTIIDSIPAYVFDTLVTGKILNENFGLVEWDYIWTEEFGQLAQFSWDGEIQYYLKGCVINGKIYGDTTFIISGIDDVYFEKSYNLYQNYPNPFNSSTVINFTIPSSDDVLLEVYTILGEKIKILIDDFLAAGNHSVRFEADNLSTGVYLYVLRTNKLVQIKKMLLIR